MKKYIIIFISIIIDGLIPNITLYEINNLTYFTPLCTIVSLIFIYEDRLFFKLLFAISILYGMLYMNNVFLTFILFFIVMIVIKTFKRSFKDNLFTVVIQILLVIFVYDGLFYLINVLINNNTFDINVYLYKFLHTIIFNLFYGIILFYITEKGSKTIY